MRLSQHKSTTSMKATIHVLKTKAGMDDETYRDFLFKEAGVRSSSDLSVTQSGRVIERLRELAGEGVGPRGAVAGLDGLIGSKLRALWIAGYDLGIVKNRTDKAMLAFLERQTGVSHVNFLAEPSAGTKAIEGLKSWLARTGAVDWPSDSKDVIGAKRAVLNAQWMRLIAIGGVKPWAANHPLHGLDDYAFKVVPAFRRWEGMEPRHYDQVQNALGRRVRAVLAALPGAAS
ncbi:MAG: regulatory protein GemA [Afipia sp.]